MLVIMAMACALGAIMGPLAGLFPALLPSAFSSDPVLWPLMRSVAWQVGISEIRQAVPSMSCGSI